ncbi:hypothetical protein B0H19DRAFT_1196931 [Mycena capillaripes]|nr:hypothetical protein B0H19DRAFT_1196931 [Mycena capillaripes]
MYQTLSIHISVSSPKIFRLPLRAVAKLITGKPASVREHTRHVCFGDIRWANVIVDFLSRCEATTDLALINTRLWSHPDLLRVLGPLPLQRLSFTLRSLDTVFPWPNPFDGSHPLFSRITHLDIQDWQIDEWQTWSGLAQIPRHTHLSTANFMSAAVIQGVLKHCTQLEVLVMVYPNQNRLDEGRVRAELSDDPRIVLLMITNRLVDWETGAREGEDYWVRASALVKQRLSGGDDRTR